MRLLNSPNGTATALLVTLATVFALGNVWYSASRSAMPLPLDGYVTDKTQLAEKHSGVDDVYMLVLDGRRRLQVDQPVFAAVKIGSRLEKAAWSHTLRVDDRELEIQFSADFWGMLVVMPAVWLTCILLARGVGGSSKERCCGE